MSDLEKGLTVKKPFKADTAAPERTEKTQRAKKDSGSAGKKAGKSFTFC